MPKNKTVFFLILMIVILIFVNIFTLGFLILHRNPNHCPPGNGMRGGPGRYLIEELDFNASQKVLFEELRDDHHHTVEPIMEDIALEKELFFSELKNEQIDSAKVDSLSKVITNLHQKVDMATFWHFNKGSTLFCVGTDLTHHRKRAKHF